MNLGRLMGGVVLVIPVLWLSGCAGLGEGEGYGGIPDNPAAAGGSALPPPGNAAYGAYPGPAEAPPLQTGPPPTAPPPAVFTTDHDVAAAIHRLFNHDPYLAPASKNVTVRVYKGVVTLRGTVPAAHNRDEIVQRIAQLPGVDHVDDQLALEGPH